MTRRTRGTVIGALIYAAALTVIVLGIIGRNYAMIFIPLIGLSCFVFVVFAPITAGERVMKVLALMSAVSLSLTWWFLNNDMAFIQNANVWMSVLFIIAALVVWTVIIAAPFILFVNSRLVGYSLKEKYVKYRLLAVAAIKDQAQLAHIMEDELQYREVRTTAAEQLIIQTNERVQLLHIAENQSLPANTRMMAAERLAATADDPAELLRMAKNTRFRPDMRLMTIEWIKDKDVAQEEYYNIAVSEPSHLSEIVGKLTRENLEKIAEDSAVSPKYKGCVCAVLGHILNSDCHCSICNSDVHDWHREPDFANMTKDDYFGSCKNCGCIRYKGVKQGICPSCQGESIDWGKSDLSSSGAGGIWYCGACNGSGYAEDVPYDYILPSPFASGQKTRDKKMLDRYLTKSETALCPKCGKKAIWYRSGAWQRRFVDYLYSIDGYDRNTLIECAECGYQNEQHFGYDDDTANDRVDKEYEIVFDDKKCVFVEA